MRIRLGMAAVLFLTCTARADSIVAFSYTFQDKTTITGTVEGDLQPDGDLVTGLHNLNAVYSGQPNTPLTFVAPEFRNDLSLSGTQRFEFFGFVTDPGSSFLRSNFGFRMTNEPNIANAVTVGTLRSVTVGTFRTALGSIYFPLGPDAVEADLFRSGSYSASVVPEPSSVALAGTGLGLLLGYHVCHRISRKAAAL